MTVRALQNVPMILSQITKVWLLLFSYFCCLRCTSNKISPLIFVHLNLGHSWRSVFYFTSLWNPSLGFLYTPNPGVSFYLLWATVPYIIHVLHLTVIYVPCISVFFCFCLGCCIYLKLLFVLPSFQDKTFFFSTLRTWCRSPTAYQFAALHIIHLVDVDISLTDVLKLH